MGAAGVVIVAGGIGINGRLQQKLQHQSAGCDGGSGDDGRRTDDDKHANAIAHQDPITHAQPTANRNPITRAADENGNAFTDQNPIARADGDNDANGRFQWPAPASDI